MARGAHMPPEAATMGIFTSALRATTCAWMQNYPATSTDFQFALSKGEPFVQLAVSRRLHLAFCNRI